MQDALCVLRSIRLELRFYQARAVRVLTSEIRCLMHGTGGAVALVPKRR